VRATQTSFLGCMPTKTSLSWFRRRARAVDTLDEQTWSPPYHVRIANFERRVAMLCNQSLGQSKTRQLTPLTAAPHTSRRSSGNSRPRLRRWTNGLQATSNEKPNSSNSSWGSGKEKKSAGCSTTGPFDDPIFIVLASSVEGGGS
jgi:hypothetical protein